MGENIEDVYNLIKNTLPALNAMAQIRTDIELMKKDLKGIPSEIQINDKIYKVVNAKIDKLPNEVKINEKIATAIKDYKDEHEKNSNKWIDRVVSLVISVIVVFIAHKISGG